MMQLLLYVQQAALFVGLFVIFMHLLWFFYWFVSYIGCILSSKRLKQHGKVAIVTGCTSGIGRAMTYQLVKEGVDLLLISRNEVELTKLKNELFERYPHFKGSIDTIAFDFNTPDFSSYKKIEEKVNTIDVGVLINNVGQSYPNPLYYDEIETDLVSQLVNVNLMSSYFMTKIVLPGMKERKRGLILFVSTASSVIKSSPLLTVYASVKSGINSFAKSLSVSSTYSLFVATKLSKIKRSSLFVPSPENYAKSAIRQIKRGNVLPYNVISCPYCFHKIQVFFFNLIPKCIFDGLVLNMHNKIRKLAMKKKKNE